MWPVAAGPLETKSVLREGFMVDGPKGGKGAGEGVGVGKHTLGHGEEQSAF